MAQTFEPRSGALLNVCFKDFNHLVAAVLDQAPAIHGGRRVAFLRATWPSAALGLGSTVNEPWIAAPHAAFSSNAQP